MEYNIYLKLTNGCQLKCEHCYNEIMMNHNHMKEDVLEDVLVWLKEFCNKHPNDDINVTLHGGEPTLYDLDKILYIIDSVNETNIMWEITTNLVYELTDKHIQIFKKMHKSFIKTSWDYKIRFNKEQEELWFNNVRKLKSIGIEVQPIVCLTKQLIKDLNPNYIFDMFSNLGLKYFNFERITSTGRADINDVRPNNSDLDKWLLDAFKIYENTKFYIPLFSGVKEGIKGNLIGCRRRQCMRTVTTINPNGTISSCPNMANISYGTLKTIDENKRKMLYNFEDNKNIGCLCCKYFKQCNGDCCQLQWDNTGCPGMLSIYKYLELKNGISN